MQIILNLKKTKAILVGTSTFKEFNNISAVKNNIKEFIKVLEDKEIFGIQNNGQEKSIIPLEDKSDQDLRKELIEHTKNAKDEGITTLIVYIAGHGFRTKEGKLFIATYNSEKELIDMDGSTALSYDTIKKILLQSKIPQKIIFIDACYSGTIAQGASDDFFKEYKTKGTYTITSSDSTELSYFDTSKSHTIFTGELLNIFNNGIESVQNERISLTQLYTTLRENVNKRDPRMTPQKLSSKELIGEKFLLFNNKKYNSANGLPEMFDSDFKKIKDLMEQDDFIRAKRQLNNLKKKVKETNSETLLKKWKDLNSDFMLLQKSGFKNLVSELNQVELIELWETITIAKFVERFPSFGNEIKKELLFNQLFEEKSLDSYYDLYQITLNLTLDESKKYVTIEERSNFEQVRDTKDEFIWSFFYQTIEDNDDNTYPVLDLENSKINSIPFKKLSYTTQDIKNNTLNKRIIKIKLSGSNKYIIERHIKVIINLDNDREFSFTSEKIIKNMNILIQYSDDLDVIFSKVGMNELVNNGIFNQYKQAYNNRKVFLPGEIFKLFILKKDK